MHNLLKLSFTVFFIGVFAFILPVFLYAQQTATGCFTTEMGNAQGTPVMPPDCGNTGGTPSADRAALLAQLKTLIESGKITFVHDNDKLGMTNGTGQVKRMDGVMITIDTKLMQFYVYMVNQGFTFQVESMIGTHSQTSSTGGQSAHWTGHAADISIINGAVVNQTSARATVLKFVKTVNGLIGKDIAPAQLLSAGAGSIDPEIDALSMNKHQISPGFTTKYVGDHTNHVHVGY